MPGEAKRQRPSLIPALVRQAAAGDRAAGRRLAARFLPKMITDAALMLPAWLRDEATSVAGEALALAWMTWNDRRPFGRHAWWELRSRVRDLHRAWLRVHQAEAGGSAVAPDLEALCDLETWAVDVDAFGVVLGESVEETAARTGRLINTVRRGRTRARKKLAQMGYQHA